jgi:hypothetical protein
VPTNGDSADLPPSVALSPFLAEIDQILQKWQAKVSKKGIKRSGAG